MTLGERLRELRQLRNLTQQDVAIAVGKKRPDIASYETKNTAPHIDTLAKMADLFNVSIDYLLGRTDDPNQIFETPEDITPERKQVIFRLQEMLKDDLPEEDLESTVQFLEFLQTRNAAKKKS